VVFDRGDFVTAAGRFARSHGLLTEFLSAGAPRLVYTLTNEGRAQLAQGHDEVARTWLERSLALHREKLDPGNPALADTLTALGELELRSDRADVARGALAEALVIRRAKLPEGDWRLGETLHLHGVSLDALGDLSGAEEARIGAALLEKSLGSGHWRTAAAKRRLNELAKAASSP